MKHPDDVPTPEAIGPMRDLMAPMRVHQAVIVSFSGSHALIYGRIWGFSGRVADGVHSRVEVRTPEASSIVAGRYWVTPIESSKDFERLYEYEREAKAKGRWYGDDKSKDDEHIDERCAQ